MNAGVVRFKIPVIIIGFLGCFVSSAGTDDFATCPFPPFEGWSQIPKPVERESLLNLLIPADRSRTVRVFLAPKADECEAWSRNTDGRLAVRVQTPNKGTCKGGTLRVVEFGSTRDVWKAINAVEEICVD
jgi:hypothetical protein